MVNSTLLHSILALLLVLGLPAAAHAYAGGPPDGYAGGPPFFETCTACHQVGGAGDGALALLDVPIGGYVPNQTYTLRIELRDPGQRRWGFELAAQDAVTGEQAGTLIVTDFLNTQLSDNAGTDADYLKQTEDGTYDNTPDGPVTWQFDWTAPDEGPVVFYVAGNAANSNNNPIGDFIYAIQQPVAPVTGIEPGATAPIAVRMMPAFPNPFAGATTIPFEMAVAGPVRLSLHDVSGRLVRTLVAGDLPAGAHAVVWDGMSACGRRAAEGVYFATLRVNNQQWSQRLTLAP